MRAVKQKVRTDFFTDFFSDFEKEPTVLQSKTDVSIFRVKSFYAEILLWLGNSAWDFWGDKFWSMDFFGFCLKPKGFF